MPLLDHFRPPLHPGRSWESFLFAWSASVAVSLNRSDGLPEGLFAGPQVCFGGRVEAEVPSAGEAQGWEPPAARLAIPAIFPDEVEVPVYDRSEVTMPVAILKFVTPGDKDRRRARRAFAARCAGYLQRGLGLVIVDVVTGRLANLHDELVQLQGFSDAFRFPLDAPLYAVSYRPSRRDPGGDQVEIWPYPLAVGQPLTIVPLALRNGPTLPLDLEATYTEARLGSRL